MHDTDFRPLTVTAGLGLKTLSSPLAALSFLDDWTGRRGSALEAARRACLTAVGDKTRGARASEALGFWARSAGIDLPTLDPAISDSTYSTSLRSY